VLLVRKVIKTIERFMNTRHFRGWGCGQDTHSSKRMSTSASNTLRMLLQQSHISFAVMVLRKVFQLMWCTDSIMMYRHRRCVGLHSALEVSLAHLHRQIWMLPTHDQRVTTRKTITEKDLDALQVRAIEKTYLRTSETPSPTSIWTSTQNMQFGKTSEHPHP
jgi:hypothetical protein